MTKKKPCSKGVTLEKEEFDAFWNITSEALKIIENKRKRRRQKTSEERKNEC